MFREAWASLLYQDEGEKCKRISGMKNVVAPNFSAVFGHGYLKRWEDGWRGNSPLRFETWAILEGTRTNHFLALVYDYSMGVGAAFLAIDESYGGEVRKSEMSGASASREES